MSLCPLFTLFTFLVIKVDADEGDNDSQLDESEILSSTRIKQRRATVAPTAIPTAQLPRYLRDSGRYGSNRTRRQSMPAQYISKQPLPSIRLLTEANDLSECQVEIDKSSAVEEKKDVQTQPLKTPVKNCRSFPLDYRLQHSPKFSRHSYDSAENIHISTGSCTTSSPGFVISRIGVDNNGYHHTSDLELRISSQSPSPQLSSDSHQTKLCTTPHSDKMRRHSIAVSKITDSNRNGANSTLPGMTDLGKYERYLCKSRDRIISVPSGDDSESLRISAARKMVSLRAIRLIRKGFGN